MDCQVQGFTATQPRRTTAGQTASGCMLDREKQTISFSKNGRDLGVAYKRLGSASGEPLHEEWLMTRNQSMVLISKMVVIDSPQ